jgi:opine dehydrogenase
MVPAVLGQVSAIRYARFGNDGVAMRVLIIGAGAGGAAAVAELTKAGHQVSLWNRSAETLAPFKAIGGVRYEGVLGSGTAVPRLITSDLSEAIDDVEIAVVTLPTFSHAPVARAMAEAGWGQSRPVVLNPGHTGGALEFSNAYRSIKPDIPPVAEFSTLTYVARKYTPDTVTVTGRANYLRAAALPGGESALTAACGLFPGAKPVRDILFSDLCNLNMVLHAPGAILAAAWVEAKQGDFTFYVEGMTPGVIRVMRELDYERQSVGRSFGHELPSVIDEMKLVGTVKSDADSNDFAAAISGGEANKKIKGPNSLNHRYYLEDFGHGLLPFLAIAEIAGVPTPVADSLFKLATVVCGVNFVETGRTARAMGIEGLTKAQLIQKVRGS